jgi:Bestrophin.
MNVLFHYQVVTLAVYSYFITCIMGRQWVDVIDENLQKQRNSIDLYFPIFTMLQVSIFLNIQETKLCS